MKTAWRSTFLMCVALVVAMPSFADEADELRKLRDTTVNLVNALVEQGVLTRAKADALISQAMQAASKPPVAAATTPSAPVAGTPPAVLAAPEPRLAPGTVRVPYVPETVKEAITQEVRQDVLAQARAERWGDPGAFPDWLKRFYWSGDIRVRGEADRFPTDNTQNASVQTLQAFGVNIANSSVPNNRVRFRARFGFEAVPGDTVTVGIRLASGGVGAGSNPGSENQTLGNYESRSAAGFDRAYLDYHPFNWLAFTAGRLGNPFFKPTTLIWADDVSLEGVVATVRPQLTPTLKVFTVVGAFPILQVDPSPTNSASSKWLYAAQAGVDWHFNDASTWRIAAALYDYRHVEGTPNPDVNSTAYSNSAAAYRQTGNTVFDINGQLNTQSGTQNYLYGLASKFHEANVSTSLDLRFVGATHVIFDGDWVRNYGFNATEIFNRTGFLVAPQVRGWQTRVTVGMPTLAEKYSWQGYVGYRYVQRDATVDAFTDQDFHLGGTDAQGYFLGARFAFEKNSAVNFRWFSAKQIKGVELAGEDGVLSGLPLAIDVAQLDFTSSF